MARADSRADATPVEAADEGMEALTKWRTSLLRERADCDPDESSSDRAMRLQWLTDAELRRFLVATRGEPTDAITRLEATLAWRADRWVWLVDMRGYTLWSSMANTRAGIQMASVFSAHYPERLGAVVLLEPPSVFGALLSAIRPFLDAKTVAKIRSVHGSTDVAAVLDELLTREQRAWVDEAMRIPAEPGSLPPAEMLPSGAPPGPETPLSRELLGWERAEAE
ncbi:hypothetical protein FNF27_03354 [Cafeteria roenbergensis]|uniref:CRAL-TRIO domain-containing protein n=1 Tax=Cafeteria roenbergensis TaxID=33653 RepID=A0A5A8EB63_CAFRO|nr:hypothetical protein FNF27_03354 [Cafeteria roenbergensis]